MGSVFVDTSAHLNKSLFGWFLPLDDNLVSHNLAHCCYGVINLSYQFLLSFRCLSVQVSATTVRQTHASTGFTTNGISNTYTPFDSFALRVSKPLLNADPLGPTSRGRVVGLGNNPQRLETANVVCYKMYYGGKS